MAEIYYTPVVSTRDAEFRGFSELNKRVLDSICPIIELTRSRRSKNNPIGDIHKCLDRGLEVCNQRRFVLDISGMESQSNSQLSDLLDPSDGFVNWTSFLSNNLQRNAVPILHLQDDFEIDNFTTQAQAVLQNFDVLALRFPTSYRFIEESLQAIMPLLKRNQKLMVFLDCGYVREDTKFGALSKLKEMLQIVSAFSPEYCAPLSSSFPISVVAPGYGEDAQGIFPLTEVEISEEIKKVGSSLGVRVIHGDYSTIHPEEFKGTVTNWVPRVDMPLERTLFYHRIRRGDGGYSVCASRVLSDPRYMPLKCWGVDQIGLAAAGSPKGKSPAFWISVRVNIHIERQVNRLR